MKADRVMAMCILRYILPACIRVENSMDNERKRIYVFRSEEQNCERDPMAIAGRIIQSMSVSERMSVEEILGELPIVDVVQEAVSKSTGAIIDDESMYTTLAQFGFFKNDHVPSMSEDPVFFTKYMSLV